MVSPKSTPMSTPMRKARGHGSGHNGTHHFWVQGLSALALVPLTVWFVVSVVAQVGANHADVVAWISNPFSTTLLVLFIVASFYHLNLGAQVMLEDYVHHRVLNLTAIIAVNFACWAIGLACVLSVLKIAFGV